MTLRYKNEDHSGQFRTQRTVNVAAARENVGSKVVQQSRIQCFNCKEYEHFAKECKKPKRVKDSAYHKEKLLLCKKDEQATWLRSKRFLQLTQAPILSQWNMYKMMLDIMCLPMVYNVLNNLNKSKKQLKKANTTLAQELKECKTILAETSKSLEESISVRDSCLVTLPTKQAEVEKFKAFNDHTIDYDKLERKLNEALGQLAHKDTSLSDLDALAELQCMYLHKVKQRDCLAQKLSKQTEYVSKKTKSVPKANVSEGLSKPVTAQTLPSEES
nr:hypothetical protein [Tanacetum cinerariifolium]